MNLKRPNPARTWAIVAAGAMILIGTGCHHKTVDDYLAAGDAAMQSTKLLEAEADYQEAAKLAPNDPRVHIALGNLYVFEHKPSDAQIEFMKVLEIDPKNAATHVALGNLYNDQNQRGLAENQYRAAVALEPDRYNYHLDLGEVLRQEGRPRRLRIKFARRLDSVPRTRRLTWRWRICWRRSRAARLKPTRSSTRCAHSMPS